MHFLTVSFYGDDCKKIFTVFLHEERFYWKADRIQYDIFALIVSHTEFKNQIKFSAYYNLRQQNSVNNNSIWFLTTHNALIYSVEKDTCNIQSSFYFKLLKKKKKKTRMITPKESTPKLIAYPIFAS